jgi:hypothetical protein
MARLISPADISYAFVSGCEEDDGDEREDEGECAGDAPGGKDNAEVVGGPGE